MGYAVGVMPKKVAPSSEFGARLYKLRNERGLTQTQLAEAIGSTQRAISHYETVADFPPAQVIVEIAKALGISTDEILGMREPKPKPDRDTPEQKRMWKKFQQVLELPEKDRRAIIRMINSLKAAQTHIGQPGG